MRVGKNKQYQMELDCELFGGKQHFDIIISEATTITFIYQILITIS